jgi:hypothetical protein
MMAMAPPAQAEPLPGVAALNFTAKRGVDKELAELISEAALSVLRSSKRFKSVIGSSDVEAMISAEQQKQALGCDDDGCLAELGGALGVPYLLTGSLGTLGGRFMLNIKLLAVDEAKVVGRVTQMLDDERALGDGLKPALDALLADAFAEPPAAAPSAVAQGTKPWGRARWAAVGLGVVGAGLSAYSYSHVDQAQGAYNAAPSDSTSSQLIAAAELGNALLIGGLVSVGAGAGLWVWAP